MRAALTLCCVAIALGVGAPAAAQDDVLHLFSVRGELGVGGMLPEFQQESLGQELGVLGATRLGVRPIDPLVIQIGYESWFFPSDMGDGQQHTIGGGLRVEPLVADLVYLIGDFNAGVALTGPLTRFTISASIGAEIAIERVLGVGVFVRWAHTFAAAEDFPSDASMLVGGVSMTLRGPEAREAAEQDRDGDGVVDRDDTCPDTAAGETPDPARRGCPATDSDGDAIFDHEDECPSTPAGDDPHPSRPGCPDADRDADGVTDADDACPEVHSGLNPDPARPGCPLPDRDGDSVIDASDACPDEPGAPSSDPARNGCPGLVLVEGGMIRILRPVFFATNRDVILDESGPVLAAMADALVATPSIRRLAIEGHTDDVGEDAYNLELSTRRAQNVMAALIQAGVAPARLEVHGFGESRPLIEAETEQARAVNRRVEFRIVDPAPADDAR